MNRICYYSGLVSIAFLIVTMLLVVSNVVGRYFGYPIQGTYELIELMAGIAVSLAIPYTSSKENQVSVDVLTNQFPRGLLVICQLFTSILSLITWLVVCWAGAVFAWGMLTRGEATDALEISKAPFRYVWVLGVILLCAILIRDVSRALVKVVKKWMR